MAEKPDKIESDYRALDARCDAALNAAVGKTKNKILADALGRSRSFLPTYRTRSGAWRGTIPQKIKLLREIVAARVEIDRKVAVRQ